MKNMDKNQIDKVQEALKAVLELDFPFKVDQFLVIQKESNDSIIGQLCTTDYAIYVFRVDLNEMRPMIKRQYYDFT
jgi:hypothetical protein